MKIRIQSLIAGSALALLVALAGCNGEEDFGNANIGGDPLGSGIPGSDFNDKDGCQARRVGVLVDAGTVDNIRYQCDGFFGYTGQAGIALETKDNLFVCPLSATSVTFLLGGKVSNLPLGTAYFESASETFDEDCSYDPATESFLGGSYVADGIYLFSVSDLVTAPARADVVTGIANTDDKRKARNVSGLLQGLDTTPSDALITIDQWAHDVFIEEPKFEFSDAGVLTQDYATFTAGEAQDYFDAIATAGGTVGTIPVEADAVAGMVASNTGSVAGLYRIEVLSQNVSLYKSNPVTASVYTDDKVIVSDSLPLLVRDNSVDPEAPSGVTGEIGIDLPLALNFSSEFFPTVMVTRRGTVLMGGALDVRDFSASQFPSTCPSQRPAYVAFSTPASLTPSLRFDGGWNFKPTDPVGLETFTLQGRLIGGYTFNGEKSVVANVSDYTYIYADLPDEAYEFNSTTDRAAWSGSFCDDSNTFDDQPLSAMVRAGVVQPVLDPEVMALLETTPAEYTLNYQYRADPADPDPDTASTFLPITIHSDGAIFTDKFLSDGSPGQDGNASYVVGGAGPAHEYEIGMVSSIYRSPDAPSDPAAAVMNILVFNFASDTNADQVNLTQYGAQFRARLIPKASMECDNALSIASDGFAFADFDDDDIPDLAFWFNPYQATQVMLTYPLDDDNGQQISRLHELRTKAYGYITATRSDCP